MIIPFADLASQTALLRTLTDAKKHGCIGVIVEMVQNQANGRVITSGEFRTLREVCSETGLLLCIDEALTAIRCGAPFAHQRCEYSGIASPDLVFFGKALVVNGTGIQFDAPFFAKRFRIRTYQERRGAVQTWHRTGTQATQVPLLISALGALEMAVAGDWVGRSKVIGNTIRGLVSMRARELGLEGLEEEAQVLGGLGSFIFVQIEISATFLVMGASIGGSASRWVRWLPRLDKHLVDKTALVSILSSTDGEWRKRLSTVLESIGIRPKWCFRCGTHARRVGGEWCRACCVDACAAEECLRQLGSHRCVGRLC